MLADMTTTESALENGNSEEPIIMSPEQPQLQEQADSSALPSTDPQENHNEKCRNYSKNNDRLGQTRVWVQLFVQ